MNTQTKLTFAAIVFLTFTTVSTQAQTLAFPGAQGFGANVTGGRAGSVYHVTTLADSGAGSFRDAVSVANRIIVFDVGGYITLSSEVAIKGDITLAGQTAPGGGIAIKGAEVSFGSQDNIIVRHMRFRPGSPSASADNGLNFYQAHDVILDHVSVEFAKWNNIDAATGDWQTHPISGITVQNSIIADPIGQQFGAHTEAPSGTWSWFNNIFANSHNRNPLAKVNTIFINNVLYNCDAGYTTHTSTSFNHDIVNNYFVAGPASGGNMPWFQIDNNQSIYSSGNLRDTSLDGTLNGSSTSPLPGYQGGGTILSSAWSAITTSYPTVSPASAFRRVVSQSGAWPIDQMDALVISQAKTLGSGTTGLGAGTRGPDGALYASETDTGLGNGGFGTISGGTKPLDTDNDGIPDFWERAFGWNTNSADSMTIQANGYARLESYINWLADPHVIGNANSTVDLSLTQFTGGFVSSPTFSVSAPVSGTVALVNGNTARFTPTAGFSGLASYKFTVTDSAGSTMTLTVGVFVQAGSAPTAPNAPTSLSATAGNAQVKLTWVQSTSTGITQNKVYRSTTGSGGPYSLLATLAATTTYTNTGLANGSSYFYVVTAVNANGESAFSSYIGATPLAPPTTVTFTSVAAQDGYVTETTETSGVGGTVTSGDASTAALRAGDSGSKQQYRTIVSFDTSSLPDGATVTSATLRLKRGKIGGTNPFTILGNCNVDIKGAAGFNGSTTLEANDFQAAADATVVTTLSNAANNGDLSSGSINATGRGFINKTGTTQFRVAFVTDDNNDTISDYMGWYGGDDVTAANRPVLEVTYQ